MEQSDTAICHECGAEMPITAEHNGIELVGHGICSKCGWALQSRIAELEVVTQFEQVLGKVIKCDICGEVMNPMYGCGWDNDRLLCANKDCNAEIVYPTSTEVQ